MRRKSKIIFAAKDRGGFDAILPVFNIIKKSRTYEVIRPVLGGAAKDRANSSKIRFIDGSSLDIRKFIEKEKPSLIFTGTSSGPSVEKELIEVARNKNILTVSIVDFWSNYRQRFGEKLEYLPDYVLAVDETMKKQMVKEGIKKNKIFILGHPDFDKFKSIRKTKPEKNLIIFYSQPNHPRNEVTVFRDFVKAMEKIDPEKRIILKLHPDKNKENPQKFDRIINNSNLNIKKEFERDPENLNKKAELVIGIDSMALFKAVLMAKKVISYQPGGNKKQDHLISNLSGNSLGVYRKENLLAAVKKALKSQTGPSRKFIEKYTENNSTNKVINFIENEIKNSITNQKIKLIILDFDRTIVDLGVNWSLVRQKIFNFCSSVKIIPKMKNPLFKIIKDVSQSLLENSKDKKSANKLRKDLFNIIKKEELVAVKEAKLIEGAKEFLEWLYQKQVKFAILSNNNNEPIVKVFKKFRLSKPAIIIGSDDVVCQKPYSEGFKKILKEIKLNPSQCLFVGDSKTDLDASRAMGIKTFILTTYYQDKKNHCDLNANLIENFNQLKGILT